MFSECYSLTSVPLFDLSSCTDAYYMFSGCCSLTSVPLFDLSSCVNSNHMLSGCCSLTHLAAIDFSNCSESYYLFMQCYSLTRIQCTFGVNSNLLIAMCNLSAEALNEVYTNLPTVVDKVIDIHGNPGSLTSNTSIATAKGLTASTCRVTSPGEHHQGILVDTVGTGGTGGMHVFLAVF